MYDNFMILIANGMYQLVDLSASHSGVKLVILGYIGIPMIGFNAGVQFSFERYEQLSIQYYPVLGVVVEKLSNVVCYLITLIVWCSRISY